MSGGGKGGDVVVGHKYYSGAHFVLGYPVDEITDITYGEREAWTGSVTSNTEIYIDKPELHGGEEREGGIQGYVDIMLGGATQPANSYLQSVIGGTMPAFRGVTSLVFKQAYLAAINPYFKTLNVRRQRLPKGFYPAKAAIGRHANPAHIIYECLTNAEWGMGYTASDIDQASFTAAADTLYDEEFALSIEWSTQDTLGNFIKLIREHIDAYLDVDPETGKYVLTLVRDDYDPQAQPLLDESNIAKNGLKKFDRVGFGELAGEVVVKFTDHVSNGVDTVAVQNLAVIEAQAGQLVSKKKSYLAIRTHELAARVAARDLRRESAELATVELELLRSAGWNLKKGDVRRFSWAKRGIVDMALRIVSVDRGTLKSNKVKVKAVEDVFGLPSTTYIASQGSLWVDPSVAPVDLTRVKVLEASYWDVISRVSAADLAQLDPDFGFMLALGARESGSSFGYELWASATSNAQVKVGTGPNAAYATVKTAIAELVTTVEYENDVDVDDELATGTLAYIGDEAVEVTGYDFGLKTITVKRGVLDTIPQQHAIGAPIWFATSNQGFDPTERMDGEAVYAKLLARTGQGTLAKNLATEHSIILDARYQRPYPPANVLINSLHFPPTISGQLALAWSHRDKTQQTAGFDAWITSNIGPEAGLTYTLEIYGDGGGLKRTVTGLTADNYTYLTATEMADNGGGLNSSLRVVIWTEIAGLQSMQVFDYSFTRV